MVKYLIRLDDACPTMESSRWSRIEDILDSYRIKPMVGIIPHNEDPEQMIDSEDSLFWEKVNTWKDKGWTLALHGFNHCFITVDGMKGLNPLWRRSEFAGLDFEKQKEKIVKGVEILRNHGVNPMYFFAPAHTYDLNTLLALKECSDIRIISDTIGIKPYKEFGFTFLPQLGGHCSKIIIPGIWTFCLHPSVMNEMSFNNLESFLLKHHKEFISFTDIDKENIGSKDVVSKILSWTYFTYRKIRGIQ